MLVPLKLAILLKGQRQYKVAATLDIDPARLSRIINGIAQASPQEEELIATYLGTPKEQLFGTSDPVRA